MQKNLRHRKANSLYKVLLKKLGFVPRQYDSKPLLPKLQVLLPSGSLASAYSNNSSED